MTSIVIISMQTGSPPPELEDGMDRPARELADYRGRIRSVVDDWMEHYRESIGIALPKRLLSSSKRHADHLSSASLKDLGSFLSFGGDRQANTSMGFYPSKIYDKKSHIFFCTCNIIQI